MGAIVGNVAISQTGGPSPVINASLAGIACALEKTGFRGKIYMPEGGVRGFMNGKYNVLNDRISSTFTPSQIEAFKRTPGSDAIASRDKADEEKCGKIANECSRLGISTVFLIGGNDTADNARIIANHAKGNLTVIHVPKTIDCDLLGNDHTPGYASAATAATEMTAQLNYESRSMGGVGVVVLMGRDASWIANATAMANFSDEKRAPHLIYSSEVPFDEARFMDDVHSKLKYVERNGRHGITVVVSEGIRTLENGASTLYFEKLKSDGEMDPHGNLRLNDLFLSFMIGERLKNLFEQRGLKAPRIATDAPNYLIRCWHPTELDVKEAFKVGKKAVHGVINNQFPDGNSGTVLIRRVPGSPYQAEYVSASLNIVAPIAPPGSIAKLATTKPVPREFINSDGNFPTGDFVDWARPLIDLSRLQEGISLPRNLA